MPAELWSWSIHTQKVNVKGYSVQKLEWKQTNGQTDGADCITSRSVIIMSMTPQVCAVFAIFFIFFSLHMQPWSLVNTCHTWERFYHDKALYKSTLILTYLYPLTFSRRLSVLSIRLTWSTLPCLTFFCSCTSRVWVNSQIYVLFYAFHIIDHMLSSLRRNHANQHAVHKGALI